MKKDLTSSKSQCISCTVIGTAAKWGWLAFNAITYVWMAFCCPGHAFLWIFKMCTGFQQNRVAEWNRTPTQSIPEDSVTRNFLWFPATSSSAWELALQMLNRWNVVNSSVDRQFCELSLWARAQMQSELIIIALCDSGKARIDPGTPNLFVVLWKDTSHHKL